MTTIAIELNDIGLQAAGVGRGLESPSPGYALLDGKELLVGVEAYSRARLKPRWVHNHFWDQLDSSPMPRPFPRNLSLADVAHAHLSQVWGAIQRNLDASTSVILALPGSYSVDQLGLILGVARACEIPVTGLVDAAVAATSTQSVGRRMLHLDALLHRLVLTEMTHETDLVRRRVEVLETGGIVSVWDSWAKHIAKRLVRQTRFDPFHHGSAEQSLFDQLPGWLEALTQHGQTLVSLESEGKEYSVELVSESIPAVSGGWMAPVVELVRTLVGTGEPTTLMVSERISSVPGLIQELSKLSLETLVHLEGAAAVRGTLENREAIEAPGTELPFVIRLPIESRPAEPSESSTPPPRTEEPSSSKKLPTHVLHDGVAHPITSEPLFLGSSVATGERGIEVGGPMPGLSRRHCAISLRDGAVVVEDHSTYGTFLNGRRVEGIAESDIGDSLRLGSPGVEVTLIAVAEDHV